MYLLRHLKQNVTTEQQQQQKTVPEKVNNRQDFFREDDKPGSVQMSEIGQYKPSVWNKS